jgi:hypothetical protein
LAALSVSMGSMVVGFTSAWTSPALVSLQNETLAGFPVSDQEVKFSWNFPIKKKKHDYNFFSFHRLHGLVD